MSERQPKLEEKDGQFRVVMPNGFTTSWYNNMDHCKSFMHITTTVIKLTKQLNAERRGKL